MTNKKPTEPIEEAKEIATLEEDKIEQTSLRDEASVLISQAISNKVDVATMEKLLEMRRQLRTEKAQEQFDSAMADFQKDMPTIQKTTQGYNYKYADLTAIVEQVKYLLAKNGFSYTFDTEEDQNKVIISCKVKHIGGHMDVSRAFITKESTTKMNASQQSGAAITYGKRYAFVNAFGILTGDEDNDAGSRARVPYQKPYSPRQMAEQVERGNDSETAQTSQPDTMKSHENGIKNDVQSANPSRLISDKQKQMIMKLLAQKGKNIIWLGAGIKEKYHKDHTKELTITEASQVITGLLTLKDAPRTIAKSQPEPADQAEMDLDENEDQGDIAGDYEEHLQEEGGEI